VSDTACPPGGWVRACGLDEIAENRPAHADVCGYPVCLVRTAGAVYALRDECTHESVPLSEGEVTDGAIECWLHGSRFALTTGRALSPPATRPVAVLDVLIDQGNVCIRLPPAGQREERPARRYLAIAPGRQEAEGDAMGSATSRRMGWRR
jgi:3-phenylpropionate/trans-cinnamate dioxygenase ferredoxin component